MVARTPSPSGVFGSTEPCSLALARAARNLAPNPAASIYLESGDDVIILEGNAVEADLTDKSRLLPLGAASRAKYKMPRMATPEVVLYSVRPRVVLAWTENNFPNNATRWQFDTAKW